MFPYQPHSIMKDRLGSVDKKNRLREKKKYWKEINLQTKAKNHRFLIKYAVYELLDLLKK